jgi:hypothetical protein
LKPVVDIAFDCLPLRSVGRVDVPLDASPSYRARCERLQKAIDRHGGENAYFLYNTRWDIENMLRFSFDGTIITDRSDGAAERADLVVALTAETCGPLPPAVLEWFRHVVQRSVLIEFNHFIAAGQLADRVSQLGKVDSIADVGDFTAMNV